MMVDPIDGRTLEQSIEEAWNNEISPSMRARVLRLAEASGRTRNSIILGCLEMFVNIPDDEPDKRAARGLHRVERLLTDARHRQSHDRKQESWKP